MPTFSEWKQSGGVATGGGGALPSFSQWKATANTPGTPTPYQPFSHDATPVNSNQPFTGGFQQQPTIEDAKRSIAGIESSGGNYAAVGPLTKAGNKAYGKYQVMDFNIPTWTKEALGTSLTPQQFLSDPQTQEKVFEYKFKEYAIKYGGYENAAKVWFGGPGALKNPNAKDILGTTVSGYAKSFADGLGTVASRAVEGVKAGWQSVTATPKSFSNVGEPALESGWESLSKTIQDSGDRLADAYLVGHDPKATTLQKNTALGSAGVGVVNALFSPVTTFLATLSPIPGVGNVADVFNKVFGSIAGGFGNVATGAVQDAAKAGIISQKTADTVTPLASELAALYGTLLAGKAGEVGSGIALEKAADIRRITSLSKELTGHVQTAVEAAKVVASTPKTPPTFAEYQSQKGSTPVHLTTNEPQRPQSPEEAATRFWNEVIQPNIDKGITIGADNMKDYFGKDYADENHVIYSKAAYDYTFPQALKVDQNPDVVLVGGGPGSAKTEVLIAKLREAGFKGIIYDSNASVKDGVFNQIDQILAAGKNPLLIGIIPKLERSADFALSRERPVTSQAFALGHTGFPEVARAAIEEGKLPAASVKLIDTRNLDIKTIKALTDQYHTDPLALLKETRYNENHVKQLYQTRQELRLRQVRQGAGTEGGTRGAFGENRPDSSRSGNAGLSKGAERVTSTRGGDVLRAAVEKKLTENLGELPTHEKMDVAEQATKALDFIEKNPEEALKVAKGEAPAPKGILPESIYTALEIKAIKEGDVATLQELAKSTVPTRAGQSLKALDSHDPYSPVKIIRDIQAAREAAAEKKGNLQPKKKAIVQEIKKEITANVSKRVSWEEFIKQIECGY